MNLKGYIQWHTLAAVARLFLDALLAALLGGAIISQEVADALRVLLLRLLGLFLNNPSLQTLGFQ